MTETGGYKKVSRYDIAGNWHNFRVFMAMIRAKPWKRAALDLVLTALAIAFFSYQALRGYFQNKKG